jgi:glycosyltransferase involved in cell wall biosynthesis
MSLRRRETACFFARVRDRAVLETTEFYAQDLQILDRLGFETRVATRWGEIPWGCDLYFVWWWSWSFLPMIKARLRGRPVVVSGVIDQQLHSRRSRAQRWVFRRNFMAADWNVVISEHEYRWLAGEFGGPRNMSYIPLGVDSGRYSPGPQPRGDFCFTVCWMKRSNAVRKSMFELVRAVPLVRARVPGMRFLIAGSPEDGGPELQDLARRLGVGDAVEFLGRVGTAEKVRLMQTCQIYLQPTRFEGFGMALAEAMSCGAPVVTSPGGSVKEVVGECGVYVDGTSPESIAEGVVALAGDPGRRRELSAAGRRRVQKRFPLDRRYEAMAEVVDSVLAGGRSLRRRDPGVPGRLGPPPFESAGEAAVPRS